MIRQHRVIEDIKGEDRGQFLEAVVDPFAAVFEVSPGAGIAAAQEGSSDTALGAMKNA